MVRLHVGEKYGKNFENASYAAAQRPVMSLASADILVSFLILVFVAAIGLPLVFFTKVTKGERLEISLAYGLVKISKLKK